MVPLRRSPEAGQLKPRDRSLGSGQQAYGVLCRTNLGRAVIDLLEGCDACLRDHIVLRTGATTYAYGTDYFAADD